MNKDQKNQFSRMLKYYLMMNNKQQIDLVNDLEFDKSTVSGWCSGNRVPKADVIIQIANYLNVNPGDLLIDNKEKENYYFDKETARVAQEMHDNKQLKMLFSAARDASPEDLETTYNMLMALKKKEQRNGQD